MKIPALIDPERLRTAKPAVRVFYCLFAGAIMNLALPPVNLWPFMLAGIGLFYLFLSSVKTMRGAALFGWLFGFGYFGAGLWWIANALLVEGNPFSWVWPLAIAGLPALLAIFTAAGCIFIVRFSRPLSLSGFFTFIAGLAIAEWIRGHLFTGFPWNLYGYSWSGWPAMSQSAAIGGSYFLTLMTLFWGTLPAYIIAAPPRQKIKNILMTVGILTFSANALYGYIRLSNTEISYYPDIAVRPVQPNIAQSEKWDDKKVTENIINLLSLSQPQEKTSRLTLIIWPETAMPNSLLTHPEARRALRNTLSRYGKDVYLLAGWVRYEKNEDGEKFYNSLAVIDRNLNILATYDKAHLVPFGEYIPLQNILPLTPFVQMDGFTQGAGLNTLSIGSIPAFSPLICYEVIFPGAVKNRNGKTRPAWLLNITNDAWYGNSPGPYQHFAQTRFRAIEEGLPIVRAANTGISGVIDPLGRVVARSDLFTRSATDSFLPQALEKPTFYSRYGDLVFWFCSGALILGAFVFRKAL
jgi:apolipoprotein N-acyltransferase